MFTELKYDTQIVQNSHMGHHAIYVFKNVFEEDYLQKVLDRTKELTVKDALDHTTNVKANMTSFEKLVDDPVYDKLHSTVLSMLRTCLCLRTPHKIVPINGISESWAMKHEEGEKTILHSHLGYTWAGSFCIQSDEGASELVFPDMDFATHYTKNTLYLWPSSMHHMATPHKSKNPRYTLAFNIVDSVIFEIVEKEMKKQKEIESK